MVNIQKNQCAYGPAVCTTSGGITTCVRVPVDCMAVHEVPVLSDIMIVLVMLAVIGVGYLALRGKL